MTDRSAQEPFISAGGRRARRCCVDLGAARFSLPAGWTLLALILAPCFLAATASWRLSQPRPRDWGSRDVGFLYDKVEHHRQAVDMAKVALVAGQVSHEQIVAQESPRATRSA